MTTGDVPDSVTRGFVSYRRDDNAAFGQVVDRVRSDLTNTYEALTGKQLNLFLDRESIGWGEDWRQKIHESVDAASVFIPVVTMRYFSSQMCMEELLTFHAAADRLGVTELILPVVLFGADNIRTDDPRPEVQLIARLNFKDFEKAWTAGYDSADWRVLVLECVRGLDAAIQRAEGVLAEDERSGAGRSGLVVSSRGESDALASGDDGVTIDVDGMTERISQVQDLLNSALGQVEVIGDLMSDFDAEGVPQSVARARLLGVANAMAAPAKEIQSTGEELEALMFTLDSEVRALVSELDSIELPEAQEQLAGLLASFEGGTDLEDVERTIQQAIETVRLISLMNVSLKKALQPAARGFRSIKNATGVFRGWQVLRADLGEAR